MCRAKDIADAAYVASRNDVFEDCLALDAKHVWDDGPLKENEGVEVIGEWLGGSLGRINSLLPGTHFTLGSRPEEVGKQKDILALVNKKRRDVVVNRATTWDKARLEATRAACWLLAGCVPQCCV